MSLAETEVVEAIVELRLLVDALTGRRRATGEKRGRENCRKNDQFDFHKISFLARDLDILCVGGPLNTREAKTVRCWGRVCGPKTTQPQTLEEVQWKGSISKAVARGAHRKNFREARAIPAQKIDNGVRLLRVSVLRII